MSDSLEPIFKEENTTASSGIKVEKLLAKVASHWILFVVSVLICCVIAFVYLRYTPAKYMAYAKVLIKDQNKGGLDEGQVLEELGVQTGAANVENEIEIFQSRTLMTNVVSALALNIHYYAPGRITTGEYYHKDIPIKFVPLYDNSNVKFSYTFYFESKGEEAFTITYKQRSWEGKYGDTLDLPIGKAIIEDRKQLANPAYDFSNCTIKIKPTEYQAIKILRHLDVKSVNSKASVVDLSVSDVLPRRAEDVLNKLIDAYLRANIDDRNATLDATLDFIDDRLASVTRELSGIEQHIETFKTSNKLTNLSEQSKLLMDYTSEYSRQLTEKEVKLRIVESLEKYLEDDNNKDRAVPPSLLVEDGGAMDMMSSYNELQLQRSSLLLTNTENSPFVQKVDKQLQNIRKDIVYSLSSVKESIKASIKELKQHIGMVASEIQKMPKNERVFLEYSRQQNIKQELYLFLLTKREESAISMSSTVANARVVDPAKSNGAPYSPLPTRTYLAAMMLGLIIPGLWLYLKELLSVKVNSKEDIQQATGMNIIGEVGHSDEGNEVVVEKASRTVIAEQFRTLRTNMQFLLSEEDQRTILLTSSMSGEGKSFVALNLAVTLSLSGAKVILLELDLRKPKISANLNLNSSVGFTQYIIGNASVEDIVQPSSIEESLKIIPSGTIPPNPSELMLSPKVKELLTKLRAEYDYVIIDSAPVGLVTDAQLLSKFADTVLYVCRMDYTYKEQLRTAEEMMKTNKMPVMNLVINDVKTKTGIYGYGYGSYGGDNYFENTNNTRGIKGMVNRLRNKK